MSPASNAVVKRSTSSRSSREPGSGASSRRSRARDLVETLARAVQRPVHGHFGDAEHLGDLACAEGEHIAQDEHGALARRKALQPGDEREPDCFSRFVASLGLL